MTNRTELNIYHIDPAKENISSVPNSVYSNARGSEMTRDQRSDSIKHA